MKRQVLYGSVSVVLAAGLLVFWGMQVGIFKDLDISLKKQKLNVIVISLCSLRADLFKAYGGSDEVVSEIDKYLENSFVFKNALNSLPWSAPHLYLRKISKNKYKEFGYTPVGVKKGMRVEKEPGARFLLFLRNNYKKEGGIRQLISYLKQIKESPFFLNVHMWHNHYPYALHSLRRGSIGFGEQKFITKSNLVTINRYSSNWLNYSNKIPFLYYMFGNQINKIKFKEFNFIKNQPVKSGLGGVIFSDQLLTKWKNSLGFAEDKLILKNFYKSKVNGFSQRLKSLFELLEEDELLKQSILIFSGDHGVDLMDSGYLHTGRGLGEKVIRFPMFVRFPNQDTSNKGKEINIQFRQSQMKRLVEDLMSGSLTQSNFLAKIKNYNSPYVYMQDCLGQKFSVRYESKYRLEIDLSNDIEHFFLLNQKGVETEISEDFPSIYWELRNKLFNHIDKAADTYEEGRCNLDGYSS